MSRDNQRAAFGRAVQQAREAKGWSQRRLAREIGVASSFTSQLEAGETGISEERLIALEAALDRVGQLGWIIGMGPLPSTPTVEVAIEADASLAEHDKRILLATLREIRRLADEQQE